MRRPWCAATRILEHRETEALNREHDAKRKPPTDDPLMPAAAPPRREVCALAHAWPVDSCLMLLQAQATMLDCKAGVKHTPPSGWGPLDARWRAGVEVCLASARVVS
jgi:hypothetical protein